MAPIGLCIVLCKGPLPLQHHAAKLRPRTPTDITSPLLPERPPCPPALLEQRAGRGERVRQQRRVQAVGRPAPRQQRGQQPAKRRVGGLRRAVLRERQRQLLHLRGRAAGFPCGAQ